MRPAALSLLLLLVACPEPTQESAPPEDSEPAVETGLDPATVPLAGACPDATRFGRFTVAETPDYAYVTGQALSGVVPINVANPVSTEGECVLLQRENLFCDPACAVDEACDFDGECIPYPLEQDLGTVRVHGLLQEVAMQGAAPGYTYFDTSLPNPPWTPGEIVRLQTGGGAFDPVTLYGVAPQHLSAELADWGIEQGQPMQVSWQVPTGEVRSVVRISLNVDLHGVTPATLECWFSDDGEGTVPAAILSSFLDLGITGFPTGTFARATADQAELGDGCMDLWLSSSLTPDITIAGYTPCRSDEDCPDGMECNEALERCE